MHGPLYVVPEGTATEFPFLRSREAWRASKVPKHLAVRDIAAEVADKPHIS